MANRLIDETSPYLLQHAHNPVDWYPWSDAALERARAEDKPILLSVGYAACHWCHVMERESFEDAETARLMNDWFVNVKVDREERPDIDSIYMTAVQAMTGHGGWPMTVFLTPDGRPFFGGTYFPPEPRHGMPAFRDVLAAVNDAWRSQRDEIEQRGGALAEYIRGASTLRASADPLGAAVPHEAAARIIGALDREWGGFGETMKFPQAPALAFLLRMHAAHGTDDALHAVTLTLDRMARGGIFDHVGGGFHRYAVDRIWLVPHFEKMLYDNGQLLRLYARAWRVTGSDLYRETALATAGWMLREMQQPAGGFSSSLDADSEGVEGRFYVWPYEELIAVTGDDMPVAVAAFAAAGTGNWEGVNVLWRPQTDEEISEQTGIAVAELRERLERARRRLFDHREGRVRPGTDDKVLAAWNGLAISGLAEAGRAFGRGDLVEAAARAATFVLTEMRRDGRLLRSWRDGRAGGPGFLEDHALMADACLTLYETTLDGRWYDEAIGLARAMLTLFRDHEHGGFYDTGSDQPSTLVRPKDLFDNAMPCGNSAASDVLLRLAALEGDGTLEEAAASFLRTIVPALGQSPLGFGTALEAFDRAVSGAQEVAIVGDLDAAPTAALLATARSGYRPNLVLAAGPEGTERPALLRGRPLVGGSPTAYVCRNFSCERPVTEPDALAAQLGG